MEKRTFRNCRFYRSGDVLFTDMEVFKGQGNDTEVLRLIGMISILSIVTCSGFSIPAEKHHKYF